MALTESDDEKFARNLSSHRSIFIRDMKCTELLSDLKDAVGLDEGTACKIRQMSFTSGDSDANELFLSAFELSPAPGKWALFINTLENVGYEMLTKLLRGEPVCRTRDQEAKLLELLSRLISHKFKPQEVVMYLVAAGCLSAKDKQNIVTRAQTQGEIAGAELLLDRVTRRKDDWFREFMIALQKAGKHELMREVDPWFAEKLLDGSEDRVDAKDASVEPCAFGLEKSSENSKEDESISDNTKFCLYQNPGKGERSYSPTLAGPKGLVLRKYQHELFLQVPEGKNTAVICPINSGKRFVALRLIEGHLSGNTDYHKKVLYLVTTEKISEKIWKRCQVFLNHISSIDFSSSESLKFKRGIYDGIQDNQIVVATGESFYQALQEESVSFEDFSLVILELGVHYYQEEYHVYKKIMPSYRNMDIWRQPQIVLLTTSLCGESSKKYYLDMLSTAEKTCEDFCIDAIAVVHKNVEGLQKMVSMPRTERISVRMEHSNKFDEVVTGLMVSAEDYIMSHPELEHVPRLPRPPINRESSRYQKWLNTIKTLCIHVIPERYFNLLKVYSTGLRKNTHGWVIDASTYIVRNVPRVLEKNVHDFSLGQFKDNAHALKGLCIEDPMMSAVKKRLLQMYWKNPYRNVLIVLWDLEHPKLIVDILNREMSVDSAQLTIFKRGAYRPDRSRFTVLVASGRDIYHSYPTHFNKVHWDCIIGVEGGRNVLTVLQQEALSETQRLSQFKYPGSVPPSHVDLINDCLVVSIHDVLKRKFANSGQGKL